MPIPKKLPKISLHPFALSGIFLLLFAVPRIYAFAVVSTVLLHEAGHLIASLLYGKYPLSLTLMPTGISIRLPTSSSYTEELTVAAAGPLMNLFYFCLASFFPSELAQTVKTVSLLLGILNILPLDTFDGGRVLRAVSSLLLGEAFAERILQLTTALTLVCLWILSLYILFYSGINVTLLIFCAYLFSFFMIKKQ